MNVFVAKKKPDLQLSLSKEMNAINRLSIPQHIAIIMDGNRRWAKRERLPQMAGHWKGAETLTNIVSVAKKLGVKVLTVYAFSTENWNRTSEEVDGTFRLIKERLLSQRQSMKDDGIRLGVIGDTSKFPEDLQKVIEDSQEATKNGTELDLVIGLNYGARDELKRALQAITRDCLAGKISESEISENMISTYLDTAKWKDPDLLIRTSGENRLSNFLLWQISYSEVFVTDVLWPDFGKKDLLGAILEYQNRELRLGR